jgi:long-chain acyl-CoA synthetase
MTYPSLTSRFLEACDRYPDGRAMLFRSADRWHVLSYRDVLRRVAALSRALYELGVREGTRVALFSANRPEWHITDFAALGLGAISVPIYFNESPDRITYIVNDSGATVLVVVGAEQVRRVLACRDRFRTVAHVIVAAGPADLPGDLLRYDALVAPSTGDDVAFYRQQAARVSPEMLATIIYTSGTTGEPKGVMLSHANISSNCTDSFVGLDASPSDIALSFLPLAHVYERMMDYGYFFNNVLLAYVERMDHLAQALREVQPTVMAAVPRVFEKIHAGIMERGRQLTGLSRRLFEWGLEVAAAAVPWKGYGRPVPLAVRLQWFLADKIVFRRIRQALGGRIRAVISGAAPLSIELLEFFWSIGVPVYQGYGLTESSPVIAVNRPGANRLGSVGRPIVNVEVRIADDGEILVRGPNVMKGYFGKPNQTAEVLDADGWVRTGDIGRLDSDGFLYISDRKKDLIKTAAGKFIAPQPIENRLRTSPYIANVVLIGDRLRYLSALIVPEFPALEARAREEGISFYSRAELIQLPWTRQLIQREIERLTPHLAQFETIKRFALLDHDFTFEEGQLTYSMKVKRHIVAERYRDLIQQMYAEDPS